MLIVTTLPEKMGTVTITDPEDTSVKIGGSAVFKADLSSTASDYRATNYKWQRREKGGKWQTIDGANGKIVSAVAGKVDQIANIETGFVLASGATVDITAQPDTGYKVSCCKVNGKAVDGENGDTFTFTVPSGAKEIPEVVSYKVTYKVNNEQGKLLVGKDTEEKTDGEISAAYGTSIKFTAVSNKFCHIKGWKLDGKEVTDTTEERRLPIQIRSVRQERYTDIL